MENMKANEETIIDLKDLFAALVRKIWIVFLIGVFGAVVAFLISVFLIQPRYESTTKIYLLSKQESSSVVTSSDLQTGSLLTKDYMTLITSRSVTEKVISKLDLNLSHEEFVEIISVTNPLDTRILNITINYNDPEMAKKIANSVRDIASEKITQVMEIDRVNTVDEANLPDEKVSPNIMTNTILGAIIGIILSILIILLVNFLDDTIKTPNDIEKYLGLSVLSVIPIQESLKNSNKKKKEIIR